MAVVSTNYVPLNSDQYEQTPEEQQAAYEEATANLQNTLLTDGIDLSGLSGGLDLHNPYSMQDEWNSDPDHYMNSEYFRAGSGMDNAENAGYMGHYYIGEDGNRYRKIVTYDREKDAMKEEYTDERMYRWSPSDEHKRTHRDQDVAEAAYGKEYKGSGGTGWYTEAEIKAAWDAGDMRQMQDQGVTWDQYWGYVTGVDELINAGIINYKTSKEESAAILQGEKEADNWMDIPEYRALVEGLGIPLQFESRGDVYNFNGFGYSRDYWSDKSDAGPIIKMAMAAAVSWAAGPALAGAFQGAGMSLAAAKAASAAVISTAQQYMTTGELSLEDALMSAALAYGGAELSDALKGSGVLGEIGSKVTEFGDKIAEGGGDVLSAAMQAGGISLVSQLVREGEIDWKGAAIAAAMAGGTVALTKFLADVGQSGKESEVLEEIKVTAQRKGVKVGDGLYRLEDGTVISDTGNVLGNMSNLDLDGDGVLNANDLQDIDVNHDYVSTTPDLPSNNYNEYAENAGGIGRQYYVDENGNVHSGPSIVPDGEGGYYNKIDGTKLKPLTGVYDENEGLYLFEDENGNIVSVADKSGKVVASYDSETKTWLDANGEFNEDYHNFLDGKYTGSGNISGIENPFSISKEQYDAFSGKQLFDDMWMQKGREGLMNLTDGEMEALIAKFGTGAELEAHLQANGFGVHYSPQSGWVLEAGVDTSDGIYGMNHEGGYIADIEGNPSGITTNFIDPDGTISNPTTENPFNEEPPQDPNNTDNSPTQTQNPNNVDTGESGTPTNPSTNPDGSATSTTPNTNPTDTSSTSSASFSPQQLITIAMIAGTTVEDVINRLDAGEPVESIVGQGNAPVTPGGSETTDDTNATTDTSTNTNTGSTETGTTPSGGSTDNTGATDNGGESETGSTGTDNTGGNPETTDNTNTNGSTENTGTTDTSTNTTPDSTGNTDSTGNNSNDGDTQTNDGTTDNGTGPGDGEEGTGPGSGGDGFGGNGNGMLSGATGSETQWGPLFPGYQFKKFQYKPPPEPTIGARLFDELFRK